MNEAVGPEKRRVPFSNIVYCGDGLTDVPAFSVVQAAAAPRSPLRPQRLSGVKRAWEKFLLPKRVSNMCFPRYTATTSWACCCAWPCAASALGSKLGQNQLAPTARSTHSFGTRTTGPIQHDPSSPTYLSGGTASIYVSDMDRAVRFYHETLA
ncbi:hypothetical protein [Hymenobacter cellulosilyticus]|uniref:Phosphoserine phosphatase n=1 Tax=Hymenobacter cellulosilyticus TaxID=2932248 RepID=A0A8T9QEJ2_9BACT|nr:hypothetical protein [Hymenobacter cellulosilyticus]UOQ75272.1 hypothetical protein MUN79_29210 [Hymenobacter cellulosilyticus]